MRFAARALVAYPSPPEPEAPDQLDTRPCPGYAMASSTACAPSLSGCSLRRHSSEIRTGCANQRPSESVRGATRNGCPYRDRQLSGCHFSEQPASVKCCLREVMFPVSRIALCCVMLLANSHAPFADAQSAGRLVSRSPIRNIFHSSCDRVDALAPTSLFLSKPRMLPPGLNVNSACLAMRQIQLLEIDPQSFEQEFRYPNWPPKFCGFAHEGKERIWVCIKG